jgi:hypothetical protein
MTTESIWRLVKPSLAGRERRREFAQPEEAPGSSVRGELTGALRELAPDGICPNCGTVVPRPERVQPLRLAWPAGEPTRLGDFTWPVGTYLPVLPAALASELHDRFEGFEPGPVEVLEERVRADGRAGKPLPARFLGAARELTELWIKRRCRLDPKRSTLDLVRPPCEVCGMHILFWGRGDAYDVVMRKKGGLTVLEGVEYWTTGDWDPDTDTLPKTRHPRDPGAGIAVERDQLGGPGFFQLDDDDKFVLCTDDVKRFLEERGATNVAFLCAGEVLV